MARHRSQKPRKMQDARDFQTARCMRFDMGDSEMETSHVFCDLIRDLVWEEGTFPCFAEPCFATDSEMHVISRE